MDRTWRAWGDPLAVVIGILGVVLPVITFWWRLLFVLVLVGALADICLRSSATAKLPAAPRILMSIGAAGVIVAMMWTPLFNQYGAEYPVPSLVYIAPAVWLPRPGAWYMRIMHYGPNPVYNIQIYFEDDDRNALIAKQGTGITTKQLQEAQTILEYPEIDPERGLLLSRQFTWFPINPSHERYTAAINTRDGGFVESVRIEQIDSKWRFRIIVTDNPATHPAIINCGDSGFPGGIESEQLPACFPTYTAFPEPSSASFSLLPKEETSRVMFLAILSYASLSVLGLYSLFALWLMGVPLCSNSQPNAPSPVTDVQPKERATITVLTNIEETLRLFVPNKALAATAFKLADDLKQFLQNQGATPPRPLNPIANIASAMGIK